jgi:prepilin-type processing-associated H-X9-DG protein
MGRNIFYCPEDVNRNINDWTSSENRLISFGYNILGLGFTAAHANPFTGVSTTTFSARLDQIVKPGNTLTTVDAYKPKTTSVAAQRNKGYYVATPNDTLWAADFRPRDRHDGVNVAYIDGHAKRQTLNEVIQQDYPTESVGINKYGIWSPIH